MKLASSKVIGGKTYLHVDSLSALDGEWAERVAAAERLAGVGRGEHFNLVRLDDAGPGVALLGYPTFASDPFPALQESWLVDLDQGSVRYRSYGDSLNPPILHRKELLLPPDHPEHERYAELTRSAEAIGLFDEPTRIGYRRQWESLIREKGYRIEGHRLVPIGNDIGNDVGGDEFGGEGGGQADDWIAGEATPLHAGWQASRQLTALARYGFSAPVQSLAGQFLVVSVMLANQNNVRGERFRDGVLTRRGTFQKYFTQAGIKAFIEAALDEEPIPVAPGVLYVFRDKDAEQRFLVDRYRSRRNLLRGRSVPDRQRSTVRRDRAEEKYQACREPLDRLWERWVALGRPPDKSEIGDLLVLTEGFGSLGRALRFVEGRGDPEEIERSRASRCADLEVYFALNLFERRRPYKHLERGLQRDIKAFFGDYAAAQATARELLFKIADVDAVARACVTAAEHGLGWLDEGQSLQLHVGLVEQLPPLLRVIVGCAAMLYGDYRGADLVKVHIGSGKVSLMRFDDFEAQPLPRMVERVKVKLREQDIDYFSYGDEHEPPYLYLKSRYINEEFPNYPEQLAFDEALAALEALGLFDLTGYGPKPAAFRETLAGHRWTIDGFELVRARTMPALDSVCGRFLRYREFIECGETQSRTGLENLPQRPESYNALYDLAVQVLDPVIDYFG